MKKETLNSINSETITVNNEISIPPTFASYFKIYSANHIKPHGAVLYSVIEALMDEKAL